MAAGGRGSLYAKLGNKFCQMSPRAADSETRLPPSTQKFGTRMKKVRILILQLITLEVSLILGSAMIRYRMKYFWRGYCHCPSPPESSSFHIYRTLGGEIL